MGKLSDPSVQIAIGCSSDSSHSLLGIAFVPLVDFNAWHTMVKRARGDPAGAGLATYSFLLALSTALAFILVAAS